MGTGRQAPSTAVTTTCVNCGVEGDGIGWTDPFTGTRTIGGTARGIKPGLAEVRIGAVADADHQPGAGEAAFIQPVQPLTGSTNHCGIGRNINTGHACSPIEGTEISNRGQILITGPTDEFDPASPGQTLIWIQPASSAFIDCHLRLRAPPISTMMRSRGSRLQRSHSDKSSDVDNT